MKEILYQEKTKVLPFKTILRVLWFKLFNVVKPFTSQKSNSNYSYVDVQVKGLLLISLFTL